ncbi:MAG: DUF4397 domain-containing protein [Chitinophagales bacterium]|nr:DUF4397 domain-containing protein [Chitinophagales bacterium]
MKKALSFLLVLCVFIAGSSCNKRSPNDHKPYFNFYNFSPGSQALVMLVDNSSFFPDGVEYRKSGGYNAPYIYDNTGTQRISIQTKVSSAKYLQTDIHMQDDYTYAVFAAGIPFSMQQLTIPSYPTFGSNCKIRFVNLCPDCDTVNLTLNGTNYTGKVPYLSASDYVEVAPGTYLTEARNTAGSFITSDRTSVYSGYQTVNVVLSGYKAPADTTFNPVITIVPEVQ